jgi:hypothetical protein
VKYFDTFNRVHSRVSFLPSFENLWERDSAPMGVAPEIVVYCLAIEDNLKSSFYSAFVNRNILSLKSMGARQRSHGSSPRDYALFRLK